MPLEWIPYSRATAILRQLEEIVQHGGSGLCLLVGPPNNGKTEILERFRRSHPVSVERSADRTRIPILTLQAPPRPALGRFLKSTLAKTGALVFGCDQPTMMGYVGTVLARVGARMLALDDAQNLLAGPRWEQQEFCSGLRELAERAGLSVLLVGTLEIFQWEPLLPGVPILPLPAWTLDDEFREMIGRVESQVSDGGHLGAAAHAATLHRLSEGRLGALISLLGMGSMIRADGETDWERALLARWVRPSERFERAQDVL